MKNYNLAFFFASIRGIEHFRITPEELSSNIHSDDKERCLRYLKSDICFFDDFVLEIKETLNVSGHR